MKPNKHPFGHAFHKLPGATHWTMRPRWQCALLWPVIVCEEFRSALQAGYCWWEAWVWACGAFCRGLFKESLDTIAPMGYEYAKLP